MAFSLIAILCCTAAGTETGDYQQARQALAAGRYDQAVPILSRLWAEKPEIVEYGLLLADGYLHLDQLDRAKKVLADMATHPPKGVEDAILLAELLSKTGQWAEIVAVLTPIADAEENQNHYELHHWLGRAHSALGSWSEASRDLAKAVSIRPDAGQDLAALGAIHLRAGRYALAAQALSRAAQNGVDTVDVHLGLTRAFYELGNFLGNVKVTNEPGARVGAVVEEGYCLAPADGGGFHVCPVESAIYQAVQTLRSDPDSVEGHLLLGHIWLKVGKYALALEQYAQIADQLKVNQMASFSYHRGLAFLGIEDYDSYLAQVRRAALIAPDDYESEIPKAYAEVAERYAQRGDLPQYIRYLEFARKAAPEQPEYHRKLGYAYWEAKDLAKAVESWRIVLELAPNHPDRAQLVDLIQRATASPNKKSD